MANKKELNNKKLTKKELRELLISAKKKADKMPKEKGSRRFSSTVPSMSAGR